MELYAGIDLHANNNYIEVIDQNDQSVFSKRLPNDLDVVLAALGPFKKQMKGIAVESTYNWYWLVDGLQSKDFPVKLANPAAMKKYEGLKHTDDQWDSFLLAHLQRLNILPTGYIYPKEERSLRDLVRRRMMFVRHRTTHLLSLQSMITRNLGINMSCNNIKKFKPEDASDLFDDLNLIFTAEQNIQTIIFLKETIAEIEKMVLSQIKLRKEYEMLLTIPGIGKILALTIMLEVGDIGRFEKAGNYSSYCRCVGSACFSNGKKKGENNRKNGNKYLAWAYVEAANFAKRFNPLANSFYQKKAAKKNKIVATKALSNKICRASYFVLKNQEPFDNERLFMK